MSASKEESIFSSILYRRYFWKLQQLDYGHRKQDVESIHSTKAQPIHVLWFFSPLLQTQISSPVSEYVYSRVERAENKEEKNVISKMFYKLFTLPVLWGL